MSNTITRDVLVLVVVSVGVAFWLQDRTQRPSEPVEVPPVEVMETPPTPQVAAPVQTANTLTLTKRGGQFWTPGYANGARVEFLVDTGASVVALNIETARAAGLNTEALDYSATVSTANGKTLAAPVVIRTLSIGPITERDVPALVIERGLDTPLLGMSFLSRLQSFSATGDTLTLTL